MFYCIVLLVPKVVYTTASKFQAFSSMGTYGATMPLNFSLHLRATTTFAAPADQSLKRSISSGIGVNTVQDLYFMPQE